MSETKHQQILDYLESLSTGATTSIKMIAKQYAVSDGTAYRAIKEAERQGLVVSVPKAGTTRIDKTPGNRNIINTVSTKSRTVKDIMKKPKFLYFDSTIGDWYHLVKLTSHTQFPVVDSNMNVCGTFDTIGAYGVDPTQKISGTINTDVFLVNADEAVETVFQTMILKTVRMAVVVENRRLLGVVTLEDILENSNFGASYTTLSYANKLMENSPPNHKTASSFSFEITADMVNDLEPNLLLFVCAAIKRHLKTTSTINNIEFNYINHISDPSKANLTIKILKNDSHRSLLEVEINANHITIAKCMLTLQLENSLPVTNYQGQSKPLSEE